MSEGSRESAREASRDVPKRIRSRLKRGLAPLSVADDAPIYLRDNQFIKDYYRVNYDTRDVLRSLFRIHNETGNIWSHLVGFLIFAWFTLNALLAKPAPLALAEMKLNELETRLQQRDCSLGALWQPGRPQFDFGWDPVAPSRCMEDRLSQQYGNSSSQIDRLIQQAQPDSISSRSVGQAVADQLGLDWPTPRWPALVFLGGAMACMLTSTVAHLFGCCSEHLGKLMWRLDYSGITILIVTSFFPPVYYGFMCQPFWRNVYLGITTVVGLTTVCVTLSSRFQQEAWRPIRAALFSAVGGWGFIPITHGWFIGNEHLPIKQMLLLDVIMGFTYLTGAAIYAFQVPERWKPGSFDLAFHSHQLFHVAVVVAALLHSRAIDILLAWRDAAGGCAIEQKFGFCNASS
ncbi:hypothetical protein WJX74_009738 [Apatococcus lobatus]|uniref:Uncharacterized protein n=1 Tax=Apatococcus lobatus TaxID=904363 RepID=A0AAW1S1A0_9CHLO